jgi:hypothetical protein
MSSPMRHLGVLGALALAVSASFGCGSAAKPDPASLQTNWRSVASADTLPAGTSITVTIDAPPDGVLVASPPGSVTLKGTASVLGGAVAPDTLVFALDVSQAAAAASEGICEPGGAGAKILGCEIAAAKKTNEQADPAKVKQIGVVIFGGGGQPSDVVAASADMSATALDQPFTLPGADVTDVLSSITTGSVAKFTTRTVQAVGTSFGAGLQAAGTLAGKGPGKTVVFLANGANGAGPSVGSVTLPDDVVVRAFSLGDHDCKVDTSGFGSLADVAARGAPGSTCQRLASLADLPDVTVAEKTALKSLTLTVDGTATTDISTESTPALPHDGPVDASYSHVVTGLSPGIHELCVRATGVDVGGEGSVETCIHVKVAGIVLAPSSHTSELGTPGQTHTVVATVGAGAAGGVPGVQVSFNVTKGPNVGGMGTMATDANGQASFTYTARQHLAGLGTDVIVACFTDGLGTNACAEATQTWQDTTPPVPSCPPGPNPGGNATGSTANGFFALTAVDAVDPDPQVFLRDAGSGTVFGPFRSGIAVKYTQAPGASPGQAPMAGAVTWHITGNGDAQVYARDASGNVSTAVSCAVPPKKK